MKLIAIPVKEIRAKATRAIERNFLLRQKWPSEAEMKSQEEIIEKSIYNLNEDYKKLRDKKPLTDEQKKQQSEGMERIGSEIFLIDEQLDVLRSLRPEEYRISRIAELNKLDEEYDSKYGPQPLNQSDIEQINQDKITAAELEKTFYKQRRAMAYPSIGDQLDVLFKAGLFPKEMADRIQEVKNLHPKPDEGIL